MSIDPATFEFYQSQAPHFSLNPALGPSRHLDAFLDRLSPGARILELGCGGGRDAAHMISRGFDVDATDGIPSMVAKANERHSLGARLMTFGELDAIDAFDAIWANACLLHCPRAELPDILDRIHRALRPDGLHLASFKLGEGEGRDLLGRLHNFPTQDWLRSAYKTASFELVEESVYAGKGSDGTQRDWMALTVRKT
uniref:class I SAM-dependent methyltransferase n=1 Tax=uncultured Erythrobacter sp. TaxID=263913 RepID=UPI0026097ED3|nr:class I SAM-dependent methyltransferase [uncultured Erythrobacter sp.]